MKEPEHNVKLHIVPFIGNKKPYWLEYPVHGWRGSGVFDKNCVEIFEGDKVKVIFDILDVQDPPATITFEKGVFWIYPVNSYYKRYPLFEALHASLEVVGHVEEDY